MKRFTFTLTALLVAIAAASATPLPDGLQVTCNGGILGKPTLGETTWQGHVEVEHPRFHLLTKGSVSIFGGPAIRKKSPPGTRLLRKDLSLEHEWISLVALGDITITVTGPDGPSNPIAAKRVVYIAKTEQILIDGKPWPPAPATPANPSSSTSAPSAPEE